MHESCIKNQWYEINRKIRVSSKNVTSIYQHMTKNTIFYFHILNHTGKYMYILSQSLKTVYRGLAVKLCECNLTVMADRSFSSKLQCSD